MKRVVIIGIAILAAFLIAAMIYVQYRLSAAKQSIASLQIHALHQSIRAFENEYGMSPNGGNAATITLLTTPTNMQGHSVVFLILDKSSLNQKGEMVDPWGTPYRIDARDKGQLEIQSAGPNKVFGDNDDIGSDVH